MGPDANAPHDASVYRLYLYFPEESRQALQDVLLTRLRHVASEHNARVIEHQRGIVDQTVYSISFPGCQPYVAAYVFLSAEKLYYDRSHHEKTSGRIDVLIEDSPLRRSLETLAMDYPFNTRARASQNAQTN